MQIKDCSKCGYPLDSVDHLMACNPTKTWTSGQGSKTGPWD